MPVGRPLLAAVLVLAGARVGVAPAEQCPHVSPAQAQAAITAGVGWLADHQKADGQYLYLSTEDGRDLGGYSAVRHGGVQLALELEAARGDARAAATAARGRAWVLDHLVPAGGGRALAESDGSARAGGSALLARSLLVRRAATGSTELDPLLIDLGRFLRSQVDARGAVAAVWDPKTDAAVPGLHDKFFTGEVLWALDGLIAAGLDDGDTAVAARVGRYLPRRDDLEGFRTPVSDHWAAYAYADLGLDRLSPAQVAHAKRVADLIGLQIRGESTRWLGGLQGLIRGGRGSGSGVGTLGEGGAALVRLFGPDGVPGMTERLRCNTGMLVHRQADDGAWYRGGVTRMDDQQHSIAALIAAMPLLDRSADSLGGGAEPHLVLWLLAAGLVLANPWRPGRRMGNVVLVALGATALVALSGPILDALDVSPASARAAAGAAVAAGAFAVLVAPAVSETGGILAAVVAVAALAIGADDGAIALLAVALAVLVSAAVPERWRSPTAARAVAIGALLIAADLLLDGVLGI